MRVFTPPEPPLPTPFQWGPILLHPHLDYQFLYGTGIQSSPGQPHNTIVEQLSPGVLFDLGVHWTLDYTPTFSFYSGGNFRNTVNQSVRLAWGAAYDSWLFSGSQSYLSTSDPNVQTAAQNDRQTYLTALNAAYQLNDTLSLDLGLNQDLNYIQNNISATNYLQNFANSSTWSTLNWLNYQFWPRLNAGLGIGCGYNEQQGSPDSVFEQYQARINWRASDKISFQMGGGLQDQQYLSGGAGDLVTPIFSGTIQYQPFEQTRLSVTASRTVSPAYYQNQTTENTVITGNLRQRLFGKLTLDLFGGFNNTKYVAAASGISADRNDDYYSFDARLSCPFLKRGKFSILYHYSQNASSQNGFSPSSSGFSYTSNQVGFEVGFSY